ncbi:hypothetical protein QZH41_007937 [Actinostola sp. cb2023]|nr:hypothetical protein QZH41_007937 [Actinostola sp. cb2023]
MICDIESLTEQELLHFEPKNAQLRVRNLKARLRVRFEDEEGAGSGPVREFLSCALKTIDEGISTTSKPIIFFEGQKDHRLPMQDQALRLTGAFKAIGRIIGHCALHNGPSLHGISPAVLHYWANPSQDIEERPPTVSLDDIADLDVRECIMEQSNIGYCPMINGSSTKYSTIYTVLKHAQMISATLGQADIVITFDLAIYMKAKQIQWRYPEEFSDLVVRMGGYHIALNYLSLLGKKYLNTGLDDVLIESGVYAAGTISVLMKGKSYNRGVRAHKLAMEALFRLMWRAFVQWYSNTHADSHNDNGTLIQNIADCVKVVENKGHVSQQVKVLEVEVTELTSLFEAFKSEARAKSKMFAFLEQYGSMVNALLQFIKAERTGNWDLHLSAVATMLPHFFAMDRPNYARWLPVYLADMKQLETKHPLVHQEFAQGGHAVSRSGKPFAQVWTDMALEQSVNADSKSKGGIISLDETPIGSSVASEIFQKKLNQVLDRLDGLLTVHDDKVIYGVEETEEEATADHNKKLQHFLLRCKEKGMKLNKKNLKLKCKEITYLGHLITQNGLNPDPEKIEAVKKMPKPTNVKGVQQFCGFVNYLAKFLPRLAETMGSIQQLTRRDVDWQWQPEHNAAFEKVKEIVTTAPLLKYYDLAEELMSKYDTKEQKETFMSHEIAERPWEKIGTDLYIIDVKEYRIVVDYFSNCWEMDPLPDTKASTMIKKLKCHFARQGIPDTVISDNGPQFAYEKLHEFVTDWGFEHRTGSPGHQQTNGKAEIAVEEAIRLLRKSKETSGDIYLALLALCNKPRTQAPPNDY